MLEHTTLQDSHVALRDRLSLVLTDVDRLTSVAARYHVDTVLYQR
jgi:hypothetical protein